MERFKDKRELVYLIAGLLGFGVMFFVFLYSANFLFGELKVALNPDLIKQPEIVRFNVDSVKELGLPPVRQ